MSLLIIGGSSCATAPARVAPPPLPERPVLASMVKDKHDGDGRLGVWLSFEDLRRLTKYAESVEAVRGKWK
jgi:hypothetical protein